MKTKQRKERESGKRIRIKKRREMRRSIREDEVEEKDGNWNREGGEGGGERAGGEGLERAGRGGEELWRRWGSWSSG